MSRLGRALRGMRARVRDAVLRGRADREMDEELRFHVEMETRKHLAAGLSAAEARRRALAAFGGVERHRAELRDGRRVPVIEPLLHDLRFAVRGLRRTAGLSVVVAITVALGIGATTIVFSLTNALLLRPLPLPDARALFTIQERRSGMVSNGIEGMLIPYDRYTEYRDRSDRTFVSLAAHRLVESFSVRLPDATVSVSGALTSADYFETLGVRPALGRAYTSESAQEVVISHALWTRHLRSDPDVIGRTLGVDGRAFTVVGVAPAGFGGATLVAGDLWAPVGLRGDDRSGWATRVVPIGRLAPGVSAERAAAVVNDLALSIPPEEHTTVRSAGLEPLAIITGQFRPAFVGFLGLLQGMATMVLLIAVANIAGVMLARGVARRREMAVRLAMGAGRGRIVRHLLAESLMLFGAGGVLGIAGAVAGTAWLGALDLPPQVPATFFDPSPDRAVLLFAVAVTGLAGVLCGLAPALQAARPELVPALKAGGARSTGRHGTVRSAFVVGQVGLAVTLLLTAALFARSLQRGLAVDIGFDPSGVVAATFNLGAPLAYGPEDGGAFQRELLRRVRALPGVEEVALVQHVPLAGNAFGGAVRRADAPEDETVSIRFGAASPRYFETMAIDIVDGRSLDERDDASGPPVAVINQELAERLWPGQRAVGRFMLGILGSDPVEVVGVTGTGRYAWVTEEPTPFAYQSSLQAYRSSMSVVVRAPGREAATLDALADIVRAIDPDVAVGGGVRVSDLVGTGLFPHRFATQVVGAFGLTGLVLAVLGIYGVLSYQIGRRTREIGVRRALGATAGDVVRAVVRRGMTLAAAGCALGIVAGGGLARAVRGFLYGVDALDPPTFVAVPLALLTTALVATWLPARKAAAVEATEALRAE